MTLSFALTSLFELFLVAAVFWGIFHEDTLIRFERRIASFFRRKRLKVVKYRVNLLDNI